jgi:hypothetical protein
MSDEPDDPAAAELGRRIAEIVAARRDTGEYPDDLEAWMDEHFRRVAGRPGGPALGDMVAATDAMRAYPPFHVPAPTESRKLGGSAAHRAVGVAIRGHMSELVDQLNAFADAVRDSVGALADVVAVPRHVLGSLQSMDDRLAEMQRTLNRLADAELDSDAEIPSAASPGDGT